MRALGGCDFPVDPELKATEARVYWRPSSAPAVTTIMSTASDSDALAMRLDRLILDSRRGSNGRYWTCIRTDIIVVSDAALSGEKPFGVLIPFEPDWATRLAAAQRLHTVWRGRKPRHWFTIQRRKRIKAALRTDDGRRSGARLRDIAIAYFGVDRVAAEPWKTSALKAQVARLAAYGRVLVGDGYRQLLRGKSASQPRRK